MKNNIKVSCLVWILACCVLVGLGESVRFQQKRERHYIDEREKDALLQGLMDSFIKSTLNYFSLPDFPDKYVLKEFQAYQKRQTWYQDDRHG